MKIYKPIIILKRGIFNRWIYKLKPGTTPEMLKITQNTFQNIFYIVLIAGQVSWTNSFKMETFSKTMVIQIHRRFLSRYSG